MGKGIVKLGEGNWAVKDGNLLAAKETNGRFKNTEFTVTRGTDATYVGKDGFIKTTPSFYNLLLRSENFSPYTIASSIATPNSTTAPDGTNAGTLVTAGTNAIALRFSQVVETGKTYTFSCYVKSSGSDMTTVYLDIADEAPQAAFTLTNDWQRVSTTATVTKTPQSTYHFVDVSTNGSQGDTFYIWGAQVVEGTEALDYQYTNGKEGMPRIDFTDNTDGHLLLEPESRNLVPYSNEISLSTGSTVSGTGSSTAVTDNYAISPDGTQNAARLVATSATGTGKYALRDFILSTSSVKSYTQSTYLKSNTGSDQKVSYYGRDTGVRGFITVTSEWQRFELSGNSNTTNYYVYLGARPEDGTDTSCDILVYGYQLEQLGYATSLIPTNGSQVTRDAETCTGAGSSADFNSEEGVLYLEVAALADDTSQQIGVYGGSITEQLRIEIANSVIKAQLFNGSYQANMSSTQTVTNFNKVGFKWKVNDFALWINGTEVVTDNSGTTFSAATLDNINFSAQNGTSSAAQAKVKALKVYKETDGIDLATLTSL